MTHFDGEKIPSFNTQITDQWAKLANLWVRNMNHGRKNLLWGESKWIQSVNECTKLLSSHVHCALSLLHHSKKRGQVEKCDAQFIGRHVQKATFVESAFCLANGSLAQPFTCGLCWNGKSIMEHLPLPWGQFHKWPCHSLQKMHVSADTTKSAFVHS